MYHACEGSGTIWERESILSFYHMEPGDWAKVTRLGSGYDSQLSQLSNSLSFKVKETAIFMLWVKCLHCLTPRVSILTVLQVPGLSAGRTISYPFTVRSVRGRWCKAGSCRLHFQCGFSKLREQGMKSQTVSSLLFLLLMCMYLLLDMTSGPLTSTRGHCCFLCCPP